MAGRRSLGRWAEYLAHRRLDLRRQPEKEGSRDFIALVKDSSREWLKWIAEVAVMPVVRGIGLVWLADGEFDGGVNSG